MAEIMTVGQDLEGRVLKAVHRSNAMTIETVKLVTDAIPPAMSVLPAVTPPLAYDFARQLIVGQRKFAEDLLHVTAKFAPAAAK